MRGKSQEGVGFRHAVTMVTDRSNFQRQRFHAIEGAVEARGLNQRRQEGRQPDDHEEDAIEPNEETGGFAEKDEADADQSATEEGNHG